MKKPKVRTKAFGYDHPGGLRPGGEDWDFCLGEFLAAERLKGRRPRTIKLHEEALRIVKKDLLSMGVPVVPKRLTVRDFRSLVTRWQEAERAPRTINLRRQSACQYFAFLVSERLVEENPVTAIPKQREPKHLPRSRSPEQVKAFLKEPDRSSFVGLRDQAMILLLLDTGLRLGEIVGVRTGDIDWSRRSIRIPDPKDQEEREVFFTEKAEVWLRRYAAARGRVDTDRFFVSNREGPLSPSSFHARLKRYGKRAGIEVSSHVLRHTFARLYILNGGDPFSLQRIMGHSDLTTAERYVRLWGTDVQKLHRQHSPLKLI